MFDPNVLQTLKERGYVYQCTNYEGLEKRMSEGPITFYLGVDPTADSLHIGHFFALMVFRYLQNAGHHGILLIGGATAQVGDPSGKSDMRKMMTREQVEHNVSEVKRLAARFIRTDGENPAIIVDNNDWFKDYPYVQFMRDVGTHFNVNVMLAADAYAKRLEQGGLTFLEMGYMLMQAYDFVYLNRTYGAVLEIGGSDQWGNIVAGTDLNRKIRHREGEKDSDEVFGLTNPLLLTKEGKKMGKTEHGALWVASDRTTPYDFYQYFYNVADEDCENLLKLFTTIPLSEISGILARDIIAAKRLMAYEITKLVHGKDEADKAAETAINLFHKDTVPADAPTATVAKEKLAGIGILDLLTETKFISSKSEARRMVQQGGILVNGEKVDDITRVVTEADLADGYVLLKRGKKNFLKVIFE
ncbi:MAG: tyrosine--tRNA ligase [Clostridiales bacterium]|jgi:tyrosyl-tRNA synthetase|nr:tyrosine--tRNA ligase [Clostridiales bacterium]